MFQYTNTYIVNRKQTPDGLDIFKAENNVLKVLRIANFKKENIVAIYKNPAQAAENGKVEFDLSSLSDVTKNYRLFMYARLSGNNMSYFANDFVFKGRPFVFEIPSSAFVGGSLKVENVAAALRNVLNMYNDKFLKISHSGTKLIVEGNNYVLFKVAKVQMFNNASINGPESVASYTGSWTDIVDGDITPCVNGFGTYQELIKDIKLPTMENRRFTAPHLDEMPIPGELYDQYIIHYCAKRGVLGTDAVGDLVKSATTHVFFVKKELSSDFETELNKVGTIESAKTLTFEAVGKEDIAAAGGSNQQIVTLTLEDGDVAAASADVEWVSALTPSNTDIKATVINNTGSEREGHVTVTVTKKSGRVEQTTVTIKQLGA